ncbi:MAG: TDT family transporter [Defluviitaleaceae bacterium]|nr:TDT family transporter [Defluviitaleaceae bacterium]
MKFIKSIPMATCGLSLALAVLGNLLMFLPHGQVIRYICGVLSFVVLIIFAMKVFLDSPHAREELKTPVSLSVLPTSTMAIMILSTYIRPYVGNLAVGIWYAAIAIHVCIMLVFVRRFVIGFKLGTVFPSWFIAGVGIVAASVTAPAMGAVFVGQIAFYVGFVLYLAILPLVVLRMNKVRVFPEPARKTVAIFTAPMSLLLVGYFSSFVSQGQVSPTLVYIMLVIAAISYIYVTCMMFSLLKIKFYPTYAAFTFPYVISAVAFRLGADFLAGRYYGLDFLVDIANITMWIAVVVVLFVLQHYIRYFRFWLKF